MHSSLPFLSKKQVNYVSFQRRILSLLIDLMLIGFIFFPFFGFISRLLYGGVLPSEAIAPILQDSLRNQASLSGVWAMFIQDPRTYTYFVSQGGLIKMVIDQILQVVFFGVIFVTCWTKFGSTPGKFLLSIKIVDAHTMEKPTLKQSLLRFLGVILSALPLFLGVLWAAFDKKHQAWHDKISRTLVVKR